MKKLLKKALIAIGVFVGLGLAMIFFLSDRSSKVIPSISADQLAKNMLDSLNVQAWHKMQYIKWTSRGSNRYIWHKPSNRAIIFSDKYKVVLDLNTRKGIVTNKAGLKVVGKEAEKANDDAWSRWCNDSFWMFAHYKVFDPGTSRTFVPMEEGKIGLMVSYETGGVTPGDKYLWIMNKNLIPEAYKMWVKVIPLGGTHATWENWRRLENGLMVAPKHTLKVVSFEYSEIATSDNAELIGWDE